MYQCVNVYLNILKVHTSFLATLSIDVYKYQRSEDSKNLAGVGKTKPYKIIHSLISYIVRFNFQKHSFSDYVSY